MAHLLPSSRTFSLTWTKALGSNLSAPAFSCSHLSHGFRNPSARGFSLKECQLQMHLNPQVSPSPTPVSARPSLLLGSHPSGARWPHPCAPELKQMSCLFQESSLETMGWVCFHDLRTTATERFPVWKMLSTVRFSKERRGRRGFSVLLRTLARLLWATSSRARSGDRLSHFKVGRKGLSSCSRQILQPKAAESTSSTLSASTVSHFLETVLSKTYFKFL